MIINESLLMVFTSYLSIIVTLVINGRNGHPCHYEQMSCALIASFFFHKCDNDTKLKEYFGKIK